MTISRCLTAAAAALVLSISPVAACDDYAEEMALAEAIKASKLAQAAAEVSPASQASTSAPAQTEPTSVAAVEAKPTTDTPAPTLR